MSTASGVRAAVPLPDGLIVKDITDAAGWDALEGPWRKLFSISPTAAPPLGWEWQRTWWRIFGPVYGKGLRIASLWRGDELVAVLPAYLNTVSKLAPVRLCLISSGEAEFEETCAEYLDFLHAPGMAAAARQALLGRLLADSPNWDEIDFSHVAATGSLIAPEAEAGLGWKVIPDRPSFLSDLGAGFEAYIQGLSNKIRSYARRLLRQFEQAKATFECPTTPERIDTCFQELVELHQARWEAAGKPGTFAAPRFREFHHSLCRQLCPTGEAVLARLSVEGAPLSVLLAYVAAGTAHYYVSGSCREHGIIKSPGIAMHLLLKRELAGRGVHTFDYLPGGHDYKSHYTTGQRAMVRLRLRRRTLRTGLDTLTTLAGKVARRVGRFAKAEGMPADTPHDAPK